MIRFTSLGSGSRGNALVIESARTRVLLDCGFGVRDMEQRLARRGLSAEQFDAILVTHEHSDHVNGVFKLANRFGLNVYMTRGCHAAVAADIPSSVTVSFINHCDPFALDALEITPFSVPHDAREPVQFVFSDGAVRLGVLTDTGHITSHIVRMLLGCDALVLECNHDYDMLWEGLYPAFLKERVSGHYGHLENRQSAEILAAIASDRLKHIIAAHLSNKNNKPELAANALAQVLNCAPDWIGIASQTTGFDWREI